MRKQAFIGAAIILSSNAQAQLNQQTAFQDSTKSLNEVVVTANKFEQKQSSTGKVITVINKAQIEKSSGRTVAQLLNEQAGVSINGALNNLGSNQTVFMRGASLGRTLILIDGIPAYDPSLINSEFDLNLLSLNNVERIEIGRGAQSTLYGSDAVAGVINIITVKQDINKPIGVKATVSGGSPRLFRGNVQAYGKSGRFIYNARYARQSSKGFSTAYDSTGKGNFEKDDFSGNNAQASVQFKASDALTFRTFAQLSQNKTDLDATIFTDETDFTVKNNNKMAGTGFRYKKNGVSLNGNYQYSQIDRNFFNDSLHTPSFIRFSTDDYYGKSQFAELYASISLSERFRLLQGADYRHSNMNQRNFSISSFGPYEPPVLDSTHSQASMYSSLYYQSANEQLNIELGGRLNVHSRYGSNHTFTFNPSYQFSDHFRLFGSIASAFKAPTLYQLFSSSGNLDLKPEESTTYEIGWQQLHSKVQNRLVFFYRDVENGIDYNNVDYTYFNFLEQKVKGIEWETRVQPIQNLNLSANYTFLDGEETTQSRKTFQDTTYGQLLRRPMHSANLTAGYSFSNGLYVNLSGKYVSSRFDVGGSGYMADDVKLDSYLLLNAYAEFKPKSWLKLFADAQNITDQQFFDTRGYNSIPFVVQAGLTLEW